MTQSISTLERWEGGFPGEHEFSTLNGLDKAEREVFFDAAERLLKHWRGNKFAGLYLYGGPGTGKTHAAIGLARSLHDEIGAEVHYRYLPELPDASYYEVSDWTTLRSRQDFKQDPNKTNSIFPSRTANGIDRNPKSVLVLDDYRPARQGMAAAAIEAGAQFGGLVIVTSNYTDPFKMLETASAAPASPEQVVVEDAATRIDPESMDSIRQARERQLAEVSESLRSRIVAGFKLIGFTGPDRRPENSFWA